MIIENILDILQAGAETSADLLDIFTSGYADSYRKARRIAAGGRVRNSGRRWSEAYKETQQFYTLLHYLKKHGFVVREGTKRASLWKITKGGLHKLHLLKEKNVSRKTVAHYESAHDSKFKIIIFDIPERERNKRIWLRAALLSLDFTLLQKSVWEGRKKLPESFLKDIREKEILQYLHIFEVEKGTLRELRG